jgi:hypothetical protein
MTREILNREIWRFELSTMVNGEPLNARALFEEPLAEDRALELSGALERGEFVFTATTSGELVVRYLALP